MNLDRGGSGVGGSILGILALLALVLGGIGLYQSIGLRSHDATNSDRISELEQQVSRLTGANEELTAQIRDLRADTRAAFQRVNDKMTELHGDPSPAPAPQKTVSEPAATASEVAASAPRSYTIRAGDVLGKIAKSQNTTVDAILKVNPGLSPTRLKVGQVIKLP
ncbi:MAG: LysM peptidoglycan-binding domain-containing protein [Kiritimatiellae bacterium]|nr:LysM peptidoglycan-binding domain-containing protein [Kiritimatiellia bacterium]